MHGAEAKAEGSAGDLNSLGHNRERSTSLRIMLEEAARVPRRRRWDGARASAQHSFARRGQNGRVITPPPPPQPPPPVDVRLDRLRSERVTEVQLQRLEEALE